jgi:hypothetical protein
MRNSMSINLIKFVSIVSKLVDLCEVLKWAHEDQTR